MTNLEFSVGKFYRTRNGRKAQIFMLDNGNGMMIGVVLNKQGWWISCMWDMTGSVLTGCKSSGDLVSEWADLESDFTKVTVDGVDYYDSKKDCTHQEALDLAEKHGLRVMESWEMHKLWVESEEFRNSLQKKGYWCASVYSDLRSYAWRFNGSYGVVVSFYRSNGGAVRCVGGP